MSKREGGGRDGGSRGTPSPEATPPSSAARLRRPQRNTVAFPVSSVVGPKSKAPSAPAATLKRPSSR